MARLSAIPDTYTMLSRTDDTTTPDVQVPLESLSQFKRLSPTGVWL